ncbi:MAG: NAD(P)/FAD-dependent oxidoreductase [Haloarculaceae archaeon]
MDSQPSVAVVGAGVAGVGVAHALRDADVAVTVFEKGREVSGRAATRRRHGCTYDYGANYVRTDDEWLLGILDGVAMDGRITVEDPIWTFDRAGTITESDRSEGAKWTYADGIAHLGTALLADTAATVHRETRIDDLERTGEGWRLRDVDGRAWGEYDALVLTPPAPQTADLLGSAAWRHDDRRPIREAIESVPYRTVTSVVLHYDFELDVPYFGLVNADRAHDVWWLSREECKAGHVPDGESLLVVQLSPDFSAEHFHDSADRLVETVVAATAAVLDDDRLAGPDWYDYQHWRYAQPERAVDPAALDRAERHDLFCAGDWVAGEGRVHLALETGLRTGADVAERLA